MYRNNSDSGDRFLVGLATGAMVGAGLALLFAPKAGTDLREDLGESMSTIKDAVSERYRDLAARAGVQIDNLQERVDKVAAVVESGAQDIVDAASRQRSKSGM